MMPLTKCWGWWWPGPTMCKQCSWPNAQQCWQLSPMLMLSIMMIYVDQWLRKERMMVTGKSQRCGNANKADEQQSTMLASSEYDIFNQDLLSILLTNNHNANNVVCLTSNVCICTAGNQEWWWPRKMSKQSCCQMWIRTMAMVQSRHQVEECHATMLTMLNANKSSDDGDSCWAVVLVLCPGGFLCHWPGEECWWQILTNDKECWPTTMLLIIITTISANSHPINCALQCWSEDKRNPPCSRQIIHATILMEKKCNNTTNAEQVMTMLTHNINEMVMVTKVQEARRRNNKLQNNYCWPILCWW